MTFFRKILVCVDVAKAEHAAIAKAAELASAVDVSVTLATTVDDLPWYSRLVLPNAEELYNLLVRDRAESLTRLAERLIDAGVNTSTVVLQGRPKFELLREVDRGGYDLVIKDAGPDVEVVFGPMDMHLLRTCPCPIWLLKPGQGGRPFTRVLVAVDPAPTPDASDLLHLKLDPNPKDAGLDVNLLRLADVVATADGAEVYVLHTWQAPGEELLRGHHMLSAEQVEKYVDDSRKEARMALDYLLSRCPDSTGRRRVHLVQGEAADSIVEFTREHAIDLVVMGTTSRTGMPALLIGNTAESILQRLDCSVLAAKPDGFASRVV